MCHLDTLLSTKNWNIHVYNIMSCQAYTVSGCPGSQGGSHPAPSLVTVGHETPASVVVAAQAVRLSTSTSTHKVLLVVVMSQQQLELNQLASTSRLPSLPLQGRISSGKSRRVRRMEHLQPDL